MKSPSLALAIAFLVVPLAGCVDPEESTDGGGDAADRRTAGFALATSELTRIRLDVVANASGSARVVVEVEREDGSDVAERSLDASGGERNTTIDVEVGGATAYWVLVRLTDGSAASVRVTAVGVAADGTESILRHETYVLPRRETTA